MPVPDTIQEAEHMSGRLPAFATLAVESVKIVYYKFHDWI